MDIISAYVVAIVHFYTIKYAAGNRVKIIKSICNIQLFDLIPYGEKFLLHFSRIEGQEKTMFKKLLPRENHFLHCFNNMRTLLLKGLICSISF